MSNAYRCSICAVDWPYDSLEYQTCPECGEQTSGIRDANPIDAGEARSRKRHAEFERWLDNNNRRDPVEVLERQLAT